MGTASTVYDIRLRYMMDDQVGRGLRGLDQGLRQTAQSASTLSEKVTALAGVAAGVFGLHAAKKSLIDFNSEMEQSKIAIAGMLQMNLGGEWTDNIQRATDLFGKLQQEAKTSVGTTKDMVEMAQMMVQPLTAAGASMEQLQKLSKGMVVASMSMHFNPAMAAIEMTEALNGTFNARNRVATALLGPRGFREEEGRRKFNQLSPQQRLDEVSKALTGPAVAKMASSQEHSFAGAMSTLQDNLQLTLGKIGLPLFKAITAELNTWNTWIERNDATIQTMVHVLSDGLREGFSYLKTVFSFIVQHKDLFLTLAKGWLELKAIGMGGKAVSGIGQALGFSGVAETAHAAESGLGGMVTKLTAATEALGLIAVAASAAAAWMDRKQTKEIEVQSLAAGALPFALKHYQAAQQLGGLYGTGPQRPGVQTQQKSLATQLESQGLIEGGQLNKQRFEAALSGPNTDQLRRQYADALGMKELYQFGTPVEHQAKEIADAFAVAIQPYLRELTGGLPPDIAKKMATKPDGPKIIIHRIEVASDDPDRFVFSLTTALRDAVKNPSHAAHVLREGG